MIWQITDHIYRVIDYLQGGGIVILPLVVMFVLTYFGLKTETLLTWSKRHVVPSKVLLGSFFVAMAVLIGLLR